MEEIRTPLLKTQGLKQTNNKKQSKTNKQTKKKTKL